MDWFNRVSFMMLAASVTLTVAGITALVTMPPLPPTLDAQQAEALTRADAAPVIYRPKNYALAWDYPFSETNCHGWIVEISSPTGWIAVAGIPYDGTAGTIAFPISATNQSALYRVAAVPRQ